MRDGQTTPSGLQLSQTLRGLSAPAVSILPFLHVWLSAALLFEPVLHLRLFSALLYRHRPVLLVSLLSAVLCEPVHVLVGQPYLLLSNPASAKRSTPRHSLP